VIQVSMVHSPGSLFIGQSIGMVFTYNEFPLMRTSTTCEPLRYASPV